MSRNSNYRPLVYLMDGINSDTYELFIAVEREANFKVTALNPRYANGTTFVNLSVTATNTNVNPTNGVFFKRITLLPNSVEDIKFDRNTFAINVRVERPSSVGGTLVQSIDVFYKHADVYDPNHGQKEIAFNTCYAYINNPQEPVGSEDNTFTPHCLIPTDACVYNSNESKYKNMDGEVEQVIDLAAGGTSPINNTNFENSLGIDSSNIVDYTFIKNNIEANSKTYFDPSDVNGFFEYAVLLPVTQQGQPRKKRKGTVTNASADPNPTSFIDSPFD